MVGRRPWSPTSATSTTRWPARCRRPRLRPPRGAEPGHVEHRVRAVDAAAADDEPDGADAVVAAAQRQRRRRPDGGAAARPRCARGADEPQQAVDDGRDPTRATRRPGMFFYTIEEGEHVLMIRKRRHDGGGRRAAARVDVRPHVPQDGALRRPPRRVPGRALPRRPPGARRRPGARVARPAQAPVGDPRGGPAAGRQGGGRDLRAHRRAARSSGASCRGRPCSSRSRASGCTPSRGTARPAAAATARSPTRWCSRSCG
jgi:hypothetical protein